VKNVSRDREDERLQAEALRIGAVRTDKNPEEKQGMDPRESTNAESG